jgi:pimeloyl-ACP methyl ester carboxylesterase
MPTVAVLGCELHYELTDLVPPWISAPETILFHHGLGSTSVIWAQWLPVLADRFRIIRFDMRAHGQSKLPQADAPLTLNVLTDDVFAVADAAGAEQFHLVGESIGGTIALNAASLHRPRPIDMPAAAVYHQTSYWRRWMFWLAQILVQSLKRSISRFRNGTASPCGFQRCRPRRFACAHAADSNDPVHAYRT